MLSLEARDISRLSSPPPTPSTPHSAAAPGEHATEASSGAAGDKQEVYRF